MRVEYSFYLNGRLVQISEDCSNDKAAFKFLHHMGEIFGNTVCEREGDSSDKVFVQVRKTSDPTGKKEYEYFELVCVDPSKPKCNYAKRHFGTPESDAGSLFPKNKNDKGDLEPWQQYKKE